MRRRCSRKPLLAYAAANVLFVDSVPQDWLFPQCSCVVIHGGAGTTAVALASGRPVVVSPVFWDQAWFADRVVELGVGLRVAHPCWLAATELALAVKTARDTERIAAAAVELAENVKLEPGAIGAAERVLEFIK